MRAVQLGEAQFASLSNVEKKAVGSVPFNKQVNIISAMRNDCERRQKEATTRADRKSFTLAQVVSSHITLNKWRQLTIPQNDFISHMKLVVKMVKTSGPTLKGTYDVLNICVYEVVEMRKEEEKLSLMSGAKESTDMDSNLSTIPDRYSISTTKA